MKKNWKLVLIVVIILFLGFNFTKYYSNLSTKNLGSKENLQVVKVGVYEYEPYYYIDNNEKIKGYYDDVIKSINKYDKYIYKYEIYPFDEVIKKLEDGEVDIVIGLNKVEDVKNKIIYTTKSIGVERNGVFSNNKNVRYANMESMNNLRLGVIKNSANKKYMENIFKNMNVNINIVEFDEQKDLINSFKEKTIDLSIQPISGNNMGSLVYEFSTGPVYIGAMEKNKELIYSIDKVLETNQAAILGDLQKSYKKYFSYENVKYNHMARCMIIFIIIGLVVFILSKKRYFKYMQTKYKIKDKIKNNEYLLYYQCIHNPKINEITGFEALLRQKDGKGKVLSPNEFLDEIEKNDMLYEISLWILESVMKDYERLHKKYNLKSKRYISVNISVNEITNNDFVDRSIELIKKYNIQDKAICFEIIERVKSESVVELSSSIDKLKKAGYLIAIDDFGMEYSNLDLLGKIEFDIIKLDRYFVYTISKEYVKEEILKFLSAISKRSNSVLVVEGIETQDQIDLIKNIDNDKIYVQGYYYSKPIPI